MQGIFRRLRRNYHFQLSAQLQKYTGAKNFVKVVNFDKAGAFQKLVM